MHDELKNKRRRDFIKLGGMFTGSLAFGFHFTSNALANKLHNFSPNAYINISSDDTYTFMCSRAEMGQDIYTSLTMLMAEELEVDIERINIKFAPVSQAFINDFYAAQLTGASTSIRDAWIKLRKIGATARTMLTQAAAQNWNVAIKDCSVRNGVVYGPNHQQATFGSLARIASKLEIPKDIQLKPKSQWKYIGNLNLQRLDTKDKVVGKTHYGIDTKLPGMLYAAIKMPHVIAGKVLKYDASKALKSPGVKKIVKLDPTYHLTGLKNGGVAVVADSYWNAKKALDLLEVRWEENPNANLDMPTIWKGIQEKLNETGVVFRESGDTKLALDQSTKVLDKVYKFPFLSHSPMEPVNTTADVRPDKIIIYTPHQLQHIIPYEVSQVTGYEQDKIEVISTFLGGGFGRKLGVDFVLQAVEISKAVGAPVNLIWTREDDMKHDSYRPPAMVRVKAGLDQAGNLNAFRYKLASPSISVYQFPIMVKDGIDPHQVEGIDNYPYDTKNIKLTSEMYETPVSLGYMRAVSNTFNSVALECMIDECANESNIDPIDYRLSMLDMGKTIYEWSGVAAQFGAKHNTSFSVGYSVGERYKNVLEKIKINSDWNKKLPKNFGRGVAIMEAYNTVLATVVEVKVQKDYEVAIEKVTAVVDAGQLVHPDQAKAQIEGSIIFGLTAALYGEITIENGGTKQDNFDQYRLMRINESPKLVDVYFIEGDGSFVGGLGEPGVPIVQPALGNAIFAACGKRCRTLPFTPENINAS